MWDLDYKENWMEKNRCFWTVLVEKTLESPLDCKEIQPVHPGGDQSWVFTGRTDVEAETLILWPPGAKRWLIWKDLDAGKDWGQEEKGMTEDEMVGCHHRLNGHGFGWTPGAGDAQGVLVFCGSWGRKESEMTERLNWTELGRWWNSSWAISNPKRWCCESAALHMPANLENSALAMGLGKVTFHSNPKERQCQRMFELPHNCIHLTRWQSNAQNSPG